MTRERSAPPGRFPGEGTPVRSPEECNLFRRIPDACGLTIQSLSKVDASFCLTGVSIQPAVHPPSSTVKVVADASLSLVDKTTRRVTQALRSNVVRRPGVQ